MLFPSWSLILAELAHQKSSAYQPYFWEEESIIEIRAAVYYARKVKILK